MNIGYIIEHKLKLAHSTNTYGPCNVRLYLIEDVRFGAAVNDLSFFLVFREDYV